MQATILFAWREFFNKSPKAQLLMGVNAQAKGQAMKTL
jgi:hypothetical protein